MHWLNIIFISAGASLLTQSIVLNLTNNNRIVLAVLGVMLIFGGLAFDYSKNKADVSASTAIKITWDERSNAYKATGKYIGERFGYGREYVAKIKTSNVGISNEHLSPCDYPEEGFIWDNDWYEGGEVELLGVVAIEDIDVPPLKNL